MSTHLTVGSLFAGIGGFDLAAEALGWETRWFVEWDHSCRFWLQTNFPGRPVYGDITAVNFKEVEPVDILCGGFPCQPVSTAGKRLGTADARWLWPHFARAIRELRPRWVVVENVPGLLSANQGAAAEEVFGDLAALGYDARWDVLSAAECGAPHRRKRLWIVAHATSGGRGAGAGEGVGDAAGGRREAGTVLAGETLADGRPDADRSGASVDNTNNAGPQRFDGNGPNKHESRRVGTSTHRPAAAAGVLLDAWSGAVVVCGTDATCRFLPGNQPPLCSLVDGLSSSVARPISTEESCWPVTEKSAGYVARLRAIGNAVVPAWALRGPFAYIQEQLLEELAR